VKVGSWAVHIREELNNNVVGCDWQNRQAGLVKTTRRIVKTRWKDMQKQMNLTTVRGTRVSCVILGNGKLV
jgi:hypothetical protein